VQRLVRDGQISAGHARALLMTPDRGLQESLAARTAADGLSVRMLEDLIHEASEAPAPEAPGAPGPTRPAGGRPKAPGLRPPGVLELEELLAAYLNTRVRVEMRTNRGRVTVEFATIEDLERIYRLMIGEPSSRA
jgi:ParB family chromosome partitioning protein